jgi:hypothetical protein
MSISRQAIGIFYEQEIFNRSRDPFQLPQTCGVAAEVDLLILAGRSITRPVAGQALKDCHFRSRDERCAECEAGVFFNRVLFCASWTK